MYKAVISYDGTRYFGWQKTKTGPSIQEQIETALTRITGKQVPIEAASRTDRGVHATGQVIQFSLEAPLSTEKLKGALNAVLPDDIRVFEISRKEFHPTLDAIKKEYRYKINRDAVQDPHERLYSWHVYQPLDFKKIDAAIPHLLGTHDFTSFSNRDAEGEENPICTLERIHFEKNIFQFVGDRFLHKMVRNLVGTLIYIGSGRVALPIEEILKRKDRKLAGITAPSKGLYLHQVSYPL